MSKNNENKKLSLVQQNVSAEYMIESPYLPSTEAQRYESLRAGFIDHLMENVTKEREHRHSLEKKLNQTNIQIGYIEACRRFLNPVIALITILAGFGIVYYGFKIGQSQNATALALGLGGVITALKWLDKNKKN